MFTTLNCPKKQSKIFEMLMNILIQPPVKKRTKMPLLMMKLLWIWKLESDKLWKNSIRVLLLT